MVQGEKGGAGRGRPHQDLRGAGARKPRKELGCVQGQGGEDSFLEVSDREGWAGSGPAEWGNSVWVSAVRASFREEAQDTTWWLILYCRNQMVE